MEPKEILDIVVEKYKRILVGNLVGIYLHGSLAMGCYTNESDIDFLVVVREPIDINTKKELIESIIHLKDLPKKGIEMSIIQEKYAREFIHPTPFELHYSDSHRKMYLSDSNYLCGGTTDRDLAAHITVIIHRGTCLYGKEIKEVFSDVPRKDYIDSIICDIENSKIDILKNPVYITLNLCRVLYYLKENIVSSKLEGGNWGKEIVPQQYRKIVEDAVKAYMNESKEFKYSKDLLREYADYMLEEINRVGKMINIDLYKGISQFGPYGVVLENDVHSYGSVDILLYNSMIKLCNETWKHLYSSYTPLEVHYEKGTRLEMENYLDGVIRVNMSDEDKIEAIANFCSSLGDKIGDCDIEELVFGGTEEEIIKRGSYWCSDLSRVGAVMFQIAGFPCRMVSLFNTEYAYNGHVINEVYRNGLWGAVDTTRGVVYRDKSSKPLSVWELCNNHNLIRMHYEGHEDVERKTGQFLVCAIYNYFANDFQKYDYTISGVNNYYRTLLEESERAGWRNLKWIFGEDEILGGYYCG